jgi:hypothetical protein
MLTLVISGVILFIYCKKRKQLELTDSREKMVTNNQDVIYKDEIEHNDAN